MTTTIYNVARYKFGTKQIDWRTDPMCAVIAKTGYVASLETHVSLSDLQPIRGTPVALVSQDVDSAGWFRSSPISLIMPPSGTVDQVVIYRVLDGTLILNISFPAQVAAGQFLTLLNGISRPGICRL